MIAFAALTGPLPKLGVVAAALLVAAVLLARDIRARAGAMLRAAALAGSDIWDSPQLRLVHRHPLAALLGAVVALAALAAVARLIARRPPLLAPLAVLALPFRIPVQAGGQTSNLLVPLYFVVAAGALAWIVPVLAGGVRQRRARSAVRSRRPEGRHGAEPVAEPPRTPAPPPPPALSLWVGRLLSPCTSSCTASRRSTPGLLEGAAVCGLLLCPVRAALPVAARAELDAGLVSNCLRLPVALGRWCLSVIGFVEYATKTIILNPKLVVANDLHTYFTVNSVFFDPDIFGRFLALAMILLAVNLLLYLRPAPARADRGDRRYSRCCGPACC